VRRVRARGRQQTSISWRIGMRKVRPGRTPGLERQLSGRLSRGCPVAGATTPS